MYIYIYIYIHICTTQSPSRRRASTETRRCLATSALRFKATCVLGPPPFLGITNKT